MEEYLNKYLKLQQKALASIPAQTVNAIIALFREALHNDRQIFVCGNGGSAASASHFVTDLGKGASDKTYRRFRCQALNDNGAWLTALGNDYSFDDIFVRQLMNLARPGDVLFMISVSGNSPNLLKAAQWARENRMSVVALVGGNRGKLEALANIPIVVDDTHYGRVEDAHMSICHMIAFAFMENAGLQKPVSS